MLLDMEGTLIFNEVFLDGYDSTIFSVASGESFDCII